MIFDLASTIDQVALPVQITRFLPQPILNGRSDGPPTEQTFCIQASVQPTTGKDLMNLPEGMRLDQGITLYTRTELFSVRQAKARLPDRFNYRGDTFQVEHIEDWLDTGNYFKVTAVRTNR